MLTVIRHAAGFTQKTADDEIHDFSEGEAPVSYSAAINPEKTN